MIFRDNFLPITRNGTLSHHNVFEPIPGEICEIYCPDQFPDIDVIEMSTGMFYYRYRIYHVNSPYGYAYLYEYFAFNNKYKLSKEFIAEMQEQITKHLETMNLNAFVNTEERLSKINDFKKYLKQKFCEIGVTFEFLG